MIPSRFRPTLLATAFALATMCPAAHAAEADIERVRAATVRLINLLVEQGLVTRARADVLLKEMEPAPAAAPAAPAAALAPAGAEAAKPAPVRVPYVPEFVRKEIKDELRNELVAQAFLEGWAGPGAVPAWVRGLRIEGDLRTRAQGDNFDADNAPAVSVAETNRTRALALQNTTTDRQRLRVRARLGASINADDNWGGSIRLTTGSTSDPLSSNQTLGSYGNRFTTAFDRAFVRYRAGDSFNAVFGRFGNPWFGTDLVWANDLGFDGVAAQWTPAIGRWGRGFVTAGVMPIQEVELSSADKWLYGLQAGVSWPGGGLFSGRVGLAYYHYDKLLGRANAASSSLNDYTAPTFTQKGNTYFNISSDPARPLLALASEYRIVNLTASIDRLLLGNKHLVLTADWARNLGFDRAAVSARAGTDVEPKINAYQLRVSFGDNDITAAGQWQAFFGYKHVERDAVLDAFTDTDLRGGGTDAKGYTLGGSIGLGKNTALTTRWLSGSSISGPPLSLDTLQVDLLLRF